MSIPQSLLPFLEKGDIEGLHKQLDYEGAPLDYHLILPKAHYSYNPPQYYELLLNNPVVQNLPGTKYILGETGEIRFSYCGRDYHFIGERQ